MNLFYPSFQLWCVLAVLELCKLKLAFKLHLLVSLTWTTRHLFLTLCQPLTLFIYEGRFSIVQINFCISIDKTIVTALFRLTIVNCSPFLWLCLQLTYAINIFTRVNFANL